MTGLSLLTRSHSHFQGGAKMFSLIGDQASAVVFDENENIFLILKGADRSPIHPWACYSERRPPENRVALVLRDHQANFIVRGTEDHGIFLFRVNSEGIRMSSKIIGTGLMLLRSR